MARRKEHDSTNSYFSLNIEKLIREWGVGFGYPVSTDDPRTQVTLGKEYLVMNHQDANRPYRIWLQAQPVNLGGHRHWMSCPCCGRRCALVYWRCGCMAACRLCYRLKHPSTRKDVMDRAADQVAKAFRKLGQERDFSRIYQSLPPKPGRMRWSTYARLCAQIMRREQDFTAAMLAAKLPGSTNVSY